jgi:PAS domain S-box-containing protein
LDWLFIASVASKVLIAVLFLFIGYSTHKGYQRTEDRNFKLLAVAALFGAIVQVVFVELEVLRGYAMQYDAPLGNIMMIAVLASFAWALNRLTESESRFRQLADLLPQIVFEVDAKGNFTFLNRVGLASTGYTEEQVRKGLSAFQLFPPEDGKRAMQNMRRMMTGEKAIPSEYAVQRKDGSTFPAIIHSAAIAREGKAVGLRGIVIDITEHRQMEDEIRAAKERLDYVVTSNPAVIYSAKPLADYSDFVLTYLSDRVASMLGFEPREFIGHPEFWQSRVYPEDVRSVMADMPRLWKEGQHAFDYRFLHKDGTYRWIREEAKVVRDADGNPIEVNGYWTDVTEEKRMQEALLRSQRLAAIGELAAMVGHDLRNPLQGIMTAAHYLRTHEGSKLGEEGKEMVQLIEQDIKRAELIVSDLLDYSRESKLELAETDVKSLVGEALAVVEIPRNIDIVDSTSKQHETVMDAEKMRRVFVNLIENAFDAMPKGGTLSILSSRTGDRLQIIFKDTGEGMTPETMEKLWSPLFTTKVKGIGLGLAIVRRFVEAHGGSMSVESYLGKGSTFTVILPIRETKSEPL